HHEIYELRVLPDHRHVIDDRGKLGRLLDLLADDPGQRPTAQLAVGRELSPEPDEWGQAQLGPEGQRGRVRVGLGPDVNRRRYEPAGAGHDVLGAHPAGFRGGVAAEADGLPDFLELARVVVPVIVEHGAEIHVDRDLVRAHELLEEGNTRLAPLEGRLVKPFDVVQDTAVLGIQRVPKLRERQLSALFVEECVPGGYLYDGIVAFREGGERGRGVEARLEEQVREHLARRPLTRGVRTLHVGVHALELAAQVLGGRVNPAPKVLRVLAGHGVLQPRRRPGAGRVAALYRCSGAGLVPVT